jgi:hypothetical protein
MDNNLNEEALKARSARLESQIDHLETELTYLDELLTRVGFPEGITTLKATAEEFLADGFHREHVEGY